MVENTTQTSVASRKHLECHYCHKTGHIASACHKKQRAAQAKSTYAVTVEKLRNTFATHGLPRTFMTDNGSQFTSAEFQAHMKSNGIKHICSSPYHTATNGLAERAVQSFKEHLKWFHDGSLQEKLAKFLLWYRLTPHSTTGVPPTELLLGRRPRSKLDLLKPNLSETVQSKVECRRNTMTLTQNLALSMLMTLSMSRTSPTKKLGYPERLYQFKVHSHITLNWMMVESSANMLTLSSLVLPMYNLTLHLLTMTRRSHLSNSMNLLILRLTALNSHQFLPPLNPDVPPVIELNLITMVTTHDVRKPKGEEE